MLIVVAMLTILTSIGVTSYLLLGKTRAMTAAEITLNSMLRQARNSAMSERVPACVRILKDAQDRYYVNLFVRQPVSTWHFEEVVGNEFPGAFGQKAVARDATTDQPLTAPIVLAQGRYGDCPLFNGGFYLEVFIRKVGTTYLTPPALNLAEGVAMEAWVWPDTKDGTGQPLPDGAILPIVSRHAPGSTTAYCLYLLYVAQPPPGLFRIVSSVNVVDQSGPVLVRSSSLPILKPCVWTHVSGSYRSDESEVKLTMNGVILTPDQPQDTGTGVLVSNAAPVLIGKLDTNLFYGKLDEVMVAGYLSSEKQKFPPNVTVGLENVTADSSIYFDSYGRLDSSRHSAEPSVVLTVADRLRRKFVVNRSGEILTE